MLSVLRLLFPPLVFRNRTLKIHLNKAKLYVHLPFDSANPTSKSIQKIHWQKYKIFHVGYSQDISKGKNEMSPNS